MALRRSTSCAFQARSHVTSSSLHNESWGERYGVSNRWSSLTARKRFWADQGYTGELQRWATERYGIAVEVVYPPFRQLKRYAPLVLPETGYVGGFQVIPKRWIVERTFSWLGRQRRLSKDYERLVETAQTWIYLTGMRLLLARLTRG